MDSDGKVKPDKDITYMINVTKKKLEIQKGPRNLEDAAVLIIEENRRRLREQVEI